MTTSDAWLYAMISIVAIKEHPRNPGGCDLDQAEKLATEIIRRWKCQSFPDYSSQQESEPPQA